jgi:hypothetical protein
MTAAVPRRHRRQSSPDTEARREFVDRQRRATTEDTNPYTSDRALLLHTVKNAPNVAVTSRHNCPYPNLTKVVDHNFLDTIDSAFP